MQKVITVNLNGNGYQLEEPGYEALRNYLDDAARQLADDPDRAEIVADLEQAIADKCARYLRAQKNVVATGELEQVLKEMGPVEATPGDGETPAAKEKEADAGREAAVAPKRLYQIDEGAWISGVCNGIAAYFAIDPTIVRIIFVALALLTGGLWIVAYIVMMFVIPTAKTSEQRAAARGLPFNAQQLIDQAKHQYAAFKSNQERRRRRRQQERERSRRDEQLAREHAFWRAREPQRDSYGAQVLAGVLVPLLGIVTAGFTIVWLFALLSLLTTGEIFGWSLPSDIPLWAAVLMLMFVQVIVAMPLRAARYASYQASGYAQSWFAVWDGMLWLGLVILIGWLAYRYVPEVRFFINEFVGQVHHISLEVRRAFG
jgi:phage shock protein PspC (stress-responsive transcriptional regulator)